MRGAVADVSLEHFEPTNATTKERNDMNDQAGIAPPYCAGTRG